MVMFLLVLVDFLSRAAPALTIVVYFVYFFWWKLNRYSLAEYCQPN